MSPRSVCSSVFAAALVLAAFLSGAPPALADCTFLNPLVPVGADPSVIAHDGNYYMVQSNGTTLSITRSETITGLNPAAATVVYSAPPGQPYSHDLWAPELEYINERWYIYVAATDAPGNNNLHRMFVLEADTDDPLGTWTMRGQVADPAADVWAIDGSVFEYADQLYMVWSGWPEADSGFPQNLYIAPMRDPLTLSGPRVLIGAPDQPWERSVEPINEGPQPFIHEGELSLVYSADASWTAAYKLGVLHLTGDDLLDPASWTEIGPVFEQVVEGAAPIYGPGHNSDPVLSPDGSEFWFLYHVKTEPTPGWQDRAIFAQRFTWSSDGVPLFDPPVPAGVPQPIPSGEPCGLLTTFAAPAPADAPSGYLDTGAAWINTQASFAVAARVRLDAAGEAVYAFVSQDGGITSNFVLGYADGRFAFTLFDPFGRRPVSVSAPLTVEPDVWYHLTGVYDAAAGEVTLYVNGEPAGSAAFDEGWESLGHTIIGAARRQSQRVDIFTGGELRDVQLYSGTLSDEEIAALAAS